MPTSRRPYDLTSRAAAAAASRERILEAAFRLFRDHHYDAVTIRDVAVAAQVSAQSVVNHFGGKPQLLEAVYAWHQPREERVRVVASGDPMEAAIAICRRYEDLGPATLRLQAIEEREPVAARLLESGRRAHAAWVARTFEPNLPDDAASRAVTVAALTAAYDLATWAVLRRTLDEHQTALAMAALGRGALGFTQSVVEAR
jgi:AcrR family transcriptional regulator